MLKLREQINASLKDSGVKVSVNDFVIKAAALALRKVRQGCFFSSSSQCACRRLLLVSS